MELQRPAAGGLPAAGRHVRLQAGRLPAAASLRALPRPCRRDRRRRELRLRADAGRRSRARSAAKPALPREAGARPRRHAVPGPHPDRQAAAVVDRAARICTRGACSCATAAASCRTTSSTRASARLRVSRLGRVQLNGRDVNLRGASIHEDSPEPGAALTPFQMRRNMDYLRQLGAHMTARPLSAAPLRAGAGGPLREPRLVRDPRLPHGEPVLQRRRGACEGAADAAARVRPGRQPSLDRGLEHRQRERLPARARACGPTSTTRSARCTTSTRRGWSASRRRASRRSSASGSTSSSTWSG